MDLGSIWISSKVQTSFYPKGNASTSFKTTELQTIIHDRAPLLLFEGVIVRSLNDILKNADNILKELLVCEVPKIEIRRDFNGNRKTETTGACLMYNKKRDNFFYIFLGNMITLMFRVHYVKLFLKIHD